ncbi:MAG TPA: glycosyltransferase [Pseudobdellovibrionaceae bacterium]|nr:glycosyltransferase [Pseudobdellovibrionaceae bacterium]
MSRVAIALALFEPEMDLLAEQLQSLVDQSHRDWILFARDESRDEEHGRAAMELMARMVPAENLARVWRDSRRLGPAGNFFAILEVAVADITWSHLAFCDQDDIWLPHKLERMLTEFRDPVVKAAHSDLMLVDRDSRKLASSCWKSEARDLQPACTESLLWRNVVTGCASMFHRHAVEAARPWPRVAASKPLFFHDHWLALCALSEGELRAVAEPLVKYRQHGRNVVGAAQVKRELPPLSAWRVKALRGFAEREALRREMKSRSMAAPGWMKLAIWVLRSWLVGRRGYGRVLGQSLLGWCLSLGGRHVELAPPQSVSP